MNWKTSLGKFFGHKPKVDSESFTFTLPIPKSGLGPGHLLFGDEEDKGPSKFSLPGQSLPIYATLKGHKIKVKLKDMI